MNNTKQKEYTLNQIISLYFSSRDKFSETVEKFKLFYDIFVSCNNLKLFNLHDIKKIVTKLKLIDFIVYVPTIFVTFFILTAKHFFQIANLYRNILQDIGK